MGRLPVVWKCSNDNFRSQHVHCRCLRGGRKVFSKYFLLLMFFPEVFQGQQHSVRSLDGQHWVGYLHSHSSNLNFGALISFSGSALSFSLGGSITTQSHSTITVYLVSLAVLALACIYIALVLPESFPISKRDQLRCRREEETLTVPRSWAKEMQSSLAIILEPLRQLKPTYNPSTGKLNWRLVYCAIHVFIVTIADGYAALAMILFFTTRYQYTPAEACQFLFWMTCTK
jgi:hypothetical protein